MPKPFFGINGSGMHTHQSLSDVATARQPVPRRRGRVRPVATWRKQLHRRPAGPRPRHVAILAPLVNSYKRLVPGYEAPVYISWARINRSALIRVPQTTRGRPEATRIELRCPDPSCNPYLAFAVMLRPGWTASSAS